jgi:hypothetical protein
VTFRNSFGFLSFVFSLTSCAGPLALRRGAALSTDEAFIKAVWRAESTRTSMSAGGSVTLKRHGVPLKTTVNVSAHHPARVRIDVSSDAGNVLLAFAANAEKVSVIDFERRSFAQTAAGAGDLASLGVRGLDARGLSALLLGRLPCDGAPSGADETHVEYQGCLDGVLLATYGGTPGPYLRELSLSQAGKVVFSATLQAHTASGFARRIELRTQETTLLVVLDELDANLMLDEDLFVLEAPPGINVL